MPIQRAVHGRGALLLLSLLLTLSASLSFAAPTVEIQLQGCRPVTLRSGEISGWGNDIPGFLGEDRLIRDTRAWFLFWAGHTSIYDPSAPMPPVDFRRHVVIAVVQGLANGFGCALAAVCDVTIAAHDARFALPEMKNDLPPTLAMYAHLDRIPTKSLLWLVYSTAQIDAGQALAHGLVSHVVPAAELDKTVEDFLVQLTARSREAIVTCKSYLGHARQMDSAAASVLAGNLLSVVLSSR